MSAISDPNLFGPLAQLMNNSQISDIMVDGPFRVHVKRSGRLEDTAIQFENDEHLMRVIRQIVELGGRNLDEDSTIIDFHLDDGTQVNVVLPPLALSGPVLTIRKFGKDVIVADDLVRLGTVSVEVAQFLRACVEAKLNIVISGDATFGKISLFNFLLSLIPYQERIILIENEAVLHLRQNRVVRLAALASNGKKKGIVTIQDLLINSLKMLPDRIIVGEVKGSEVFDMVQAMNKGYIRGMTFIQAQSPPDALARLEKMAIQDNLTVPILKIRKMIASTIDLIVQQTKLQDGSWKVANVTEVQGFDGELQTLADIFVFEQQGLEHGKIVGRLKPTGKRPTFLERIKATSVPLPPNLFGF